MIAPSVICSGAAYSGVSARNRVRVGAVSGVAAAGGDPLRALGGRGLEQPGDAEVEELHLARIADQDVAGLEVAVHHQVVVGVPDRGADLEQQAQT